MPVEVIWYDEEKTIVHQIYSGNVTTDDYYVAIKLSAKLVSTVTYPVDIIIDGTNGNTKMIGFIAASRYANKLVPENQRLVIGVKISSLLQAMIHISSKFAPKATENVHFVDTIEEAYQFLKEYRLKLNDDK